MAVLINNQDRAGQTTEPGDWCASNAPASNTQATITIPPPGAGLCHVVTSICARIVTNGVATAQNKQVNLIFGDTGEPASMSFAVGVQATNGAADQVALTALHIEATVAMPVTLEFSAAGGANTTESVAITGYTKNKVP